jgi:hypothetical protein
MSGVSQGTGENLAIVVIVYDKFMYEPFDVRNVNAVWVGLQRRLSCDVCDEPITTALQV